MRFESLPFRPYVSTLLFGMRFAKSLFGQFPRECTVCGYKGRFLAFANPLHLGVNIDSRCPSCISLERQRLIALADRERNFFAGKELLHFAPEPGMQAYIRRRNPKRYVTCDYSEPNVDLQIDIQDIALSDNSFDVIYCSHVLEHVDEDRAIPELYRVLRPGGLLLAMVPLIEGWQQSYIDASKTATEDERILHFNQEDHTRFYGRDFRERLERPGFAAEDYTAVEPHVSRHALIRGEKIFLCRKPA